MDSNDFYATLNGIVNKNETPNNSIYIRRVCSVPCEAKSFDSGQPDGEMEGTGRLTCACS